MPPLWRFQLTPIGTDPPAVSERLLDAIRYAEGAGLRVGVVVLELDASRCPDRDAVKVRRWLKHALRGCGLRAKWPTGDAPIGPEVRK